MQSETSFVITWKKKCISRKSICGLWHWNCSLEKWPPCFQMLGCVCSRWKVKGWWPHSVSLTGRCQSSFAPESWGVEDGGGLQSSLRRAYSLLETSPPCWELSLAYLKAVDTVGLTTLSLLGLKHQSGKKSEQVEKVQCLSGVKQPFPHFQFPLILIRKYEAKTVSRVIPTNTYGRKTSTAYFKRFNLS